MTGLSAIILAAGKGTRMKSDLPKVVHPVADAPMVCWVVDACIEAGCDRIVVVVGYKQEDVRAALESRVGGDVTIEFAVQEEQHGTGHAVQCAAYLFDEAAQQPGQIGRCQGAIVQRPGPLEPAQETGDVELDLTIKNEAQETRVMGTASVKLPLE